MASNDLSHAGGGGARQFVLQRESELRCEVAWEQRLRLRLVSGTAEIFGTEITDAEWLTFQGGEKFAVFTWHGATIEVDGSPEVLYVADETPMVHYVNVHAILHARRKLAEQEQQQQELQKAENGGVGSHLEGTSMRKGGDGRGPRVMVVGPTDSGKSTLARILASYGARADSRPMYVDVDVGQGGGGLGLPGVVGACPVEAPVHPTSGFPQDANLLFFYGHVTPSVNPDVYKVVTKELGQMLEQQMQSNPAAMASGMIVNSMGWVESVGYKLQLHVIESLGIDVVLVLGQERLYSMLREQFDQTGRGQQQQQLQVLSMAAAPAGARKVEVVKLLKSGGVVMRNQKHRQRMRQMRMKEYFYGLENELALQPHLTVCGFSDVVICRVRTSQVVPQSALPIGAQPATDPTRVIQVPVTRDLVHAVLAVSYAKEPEAVLSSNVAGFVHVKNVDMEAGKMTYLAPCPGPLPNNILIAGSVMWVE